MGRSPFCDKVGLKRGTWTSEEDQKLTTYIEQNGHGSWRSLPAKAGLRRCGKSCRLRWNNYLRPDIKRGEFSVKEEQTIIQLHALLGNRWSTIASYLPKRTDNDIKNLWNTHLKKKLTKMGIDPVTHKPRTLATLFPGQEKAAANLSHTAQWERARLQAEARLTLESKIATIYPTLISPLPPEPAPAVNAPARASYRVENTLSNDYNELMKLVGHEASTSVVDKFEGFSHASAIYSDACVSNDYLSRSDQNLTRNINGLVDDCSSNGINGYIESDEFAWNNLVGDGFSSASFAYGDAGGIFLTDVA